MAPIEPMMACIEPTLVPIEPRAPINNRLRKLRDSQLSQNLLPQYPQNHRKKRGNHHHQAMTTDESDEHTLAYDVMIPTNILLNPP
jgi:hypothetical protein